MWALRCCAHCTHAHTCTHARTHTHSYAHDIHTRSYTHACAYAHTITYTHHLCGKGTAPPPESSVEHMARLLLSSLPPVHLALQQALADALAPPPAAAATVAMAIGLRACSAATRASAPLTGCAGTAPRAPTLTCATPATAAPPRCPPPAPTWLRTRSSPCGRCRGRKQQQQQHRRSRGAGRGRAGAGHAHSPARGRARGRGRCQARLGRRCGARRRPGLADAARAGRAPA